MDYKNAGVDIEAGYKSVELMKEHVKKTMRPEVLGGIGGFSGAFSAESFKNMDVMVKRAVMAAVLSSLPVFFNNTEEIQGYINNSLMQCNDEAEQKAVVELVKMMISDN